MTGPTAVLTLLSMLAAAPQAHAQISPAAEPAPAPVAPPPRVMVEGAFGWAAYVDESVIWHTPVGVGLRVQVAPRVSVGPEVQYLAGPGNDRDVIISGNLVIDALAARPDRPRRTTPYLLVGGGWFDHRNRYGNIAIRHNQGGAIVGVGVRAWNADWLYVTADARVGGDRHLRLAALVGVALK